MGDAEDDVGSTDRVSHGHGLHDSIVLDGMLRDDGERDTDVGESGEE